MASYAVAGALAGALGQAGLLTRAAPVLQPLMFALAFGNWWQGAALMLAFGVGTLPNLLGVGLLVWRQLGRLRAARVPRAVAGCAIALFGIYGLIKTLQPAAMGSDGLLCYFVPGLGGLLP